MSRQDPSTDIENVNEAYRLEHLRAEHYATALRTIAGTSAYDSYIATYRDAGGGYEGLQAVAHSALTFEPFDEASPSEGKETP